MASILDIANKLASDSWNTVSIADNQERADVIIDLFKQIQARGKELFELKGGFRLKEAVLDKCDEMMRKGYPALTETCLALEATIRSLPPPHWSKLPEAVLMTFELPGGYKTIGVEGDTLTLLPATRQVVWTRPTEERTFHIKHFYNHYMRHYMDQDDVSFYGHMSLSDMAKHMWMIHEDMSVRTWLETQQEEASATATAAAATAEAEAATTLTKMATTATAASDATTTAEYEEYVVNGFKDLPEQFEVAYWVPGHPHWSVILLPHFSSDFEAPTYRAMVVRKGRLMSLFEMRARYREEHGIPKETDAPSPTPLPTFLRDLYMIRPDFSRSTMSLLAVVLGWSPEQKSEIGTDRQIRLAEPEPEIPAWAFQEVHREPYSYRILRRAIDNLKHFPTPMPVTVTWNGRRVMGVLTGNSLTTLAVDFKGNCVADSFGDWNPPYAMTMGHLRWHEPYRSRIDYLETWVPTTLYETTGIRFTENDFNILVLKDIYADGQDLFSVAATWTPARMATLGHSSKAEHTIVERYPLLPKTVRLVHVREGKPPLPFELFPHYRKDYKTPIYRSKVMVEKEYGRIRSFYSFWIKHLEPSQVERSSDSLEATFRTLYLADRPETTLLEVLTTWTPEQIVALGTV